MGIAARGDLREMGDTQNLLRARGGEATKGVADASADATADAAVDFVKDGDATARELSISARARLIIRHDWSHFQCEH